jgi:hypothetical protein
MRISRKKAADFLAKTAALLYDIQVVRADFHPFRAADAFS